MNILQIANYSAPYAGNFILSLLNLESKIVDGTTVYLFPMDTKNRAYASKFKHVFYLTGNFTRDTLLIRKIIRIYKIDIIHSHFSSSEQNLAIMIPVLFNSRIHYIKHEHGEVKRIGGFKKAIRQFLRFRVDVFISCNYPIERQLIEDEVSMEKIKTITNAIDFGRLDVNERIMTNNNIQILMFGSDWYRKGGDIAIKAVSKLKNFTLNIALSSGLDYVKDKIVHDFGYIPDFINFLPPRNDVASYYHMADVFISPSRSEGLPYSIVEAMYCETLVVVSDIQPQQNIVPSEFMFPTENYEELAAKIKYVLKIENRETLKKEFKKKAIANYNVDNWSNKILKIYKASLF